MVNMCVLPIFHCSLCVLCIIPFFLGWFIPLSRWLKHSIPADCCSCTEQYSVLSIRYLHSLWIQFAYTVCEIGCRIKAKCFYSPQKLHSAAWCTPCLVELDLLTRRYLLILSSVGCFTTGLQLVLANSQVACHSQWLWHATSLLASDAK